MSSAEHLLGMQDKRELVRAAWPVVHWHSMSVIPQPDEGTAAMRHGTFQSISMSDERWAREETYSALRDAREVRSLSSDDDERSRECSDGGETHVD